MPVSCAVVCHTWNTIVIVCDDDDDDYDDDDDNNNNNNNCEACSEAFATQFFIGSNLLYSYLNLLIE
jgi:hypothetical protein